MSDDFREELSVELNIKLVDYNLTLYLSENNEKMAVELREINTADTWKGIFECAYIEDLTRKTGNFKSFLIFINMLKTAFKNESNTVNLDILTYSDLENLRSKKLSNNSNASSKFTSSFVNNNKRYLILTYNVEFDRINYPLQLNYMGKADVNVLLETIEKLKNKLKSLETQPILNNANQKELEKLKKENEILRKEKEALSLAMDQVETSTTIDSTQKDVKILKQIIKTLEEKSMKEKNIYQKQIQKKKNEIEILKEQLDEQRMIERNLRNEIKHLTSELRVYKQRKRDSSVDSYKREAYSRSCSREPLSRFVEHRDRRSLSRNSRTNNTTNHVVQSRNNSKSSSLRQRSVSPANSLSSMRSNSSTTSRSKFNPTEYIKNKKLKQEQIELQKKREMRKRLNSGGSGSSTTKYNTQNNSYFEGDVDSYLSSEVQSVSSRNTRKPIILNRRKSTNSNEPNQSEFSGLEEDTIDLDLKSYQLASELKKKSSAKSKSNKFAKPDMFDRNEEMKEIDQKLKSLEILIKNNIM